jgi:Fe-S cluster biosynthesis and repair protein YggX
MTRMVFCKKLKKELPGLDSPPFPGPRGQEIYETISAEAWQAWQQHQTMLINEKQLNMMDKESRRFLSEEMTKYFSGQEVEQAEGYVPPKA